MGAVGLRLPYGLEAVEHLEDAFSQPANTVPVSANQLRAFFRIALLQERELMRVVDRMITHLERVRVGAG